MPPIPQPAPVSDPIAALRTIWPIAGADGPIARRDAASGGGDAGQDMTDWRAIATAVGCEVALDQSACAMGAIRGRRAAGAGADLLCLALMHGPGRMTLRQVVRQAQRSGLGRFGEAALYRRLCRATDWLTVVGQDLLRRRLAAGAGAGLSATAPALATGAGLDFILAFTPWPPGCFTEAQLQVLLGVRWAYVAATLRRARLVPPDADSAVLAPARQAALLIGAIMRPDG